MVWCNVKLRLNLQSHRFNFLTQSVSCISITKYLVKMQSVLWVLFHIESCISFAYGRTNTMTWIAYTYLTIPKGYYLNFQFLLTFTLCIFTYNLFSWYFHSNIGNLNLVKLQYVYNSKHRLLVSFLYKRYLSIHPRFCISYYNDRFPCLRIYNKTCNQYLILSFKEWNGSIGIRNIFYSSQREAFFLQLEIYY